VNVCAVIPVYRHVDTVAAVIDALRAAELPCFVIDDGNDGPDAEQLRRTVGDRPGSQLVTRALNGGKGAAIKTGLRAARAAGYTHALQIDADGQHDAGDIGRFLALARRFPDRMIYGVPQFDDSVPRSRLYGRYATHVWVWINTLSTEVQDAMCGFRIYPLRETLALMDRRRLPDRMDFDIEVLVRLHWAGIRFEPVATRVRYPAGGSSHFRLWHDNALISWMHARLFFGMLLRLPILLWRKTRSRGPGTPRHWASIGEGTSVGGIFLLLWVHRVAGRLPFRVVVFPVVFCNWVLRPALRRASLDYLRRVEQARASGHVPTSADSLAHVMRFADTLLDKLLAVAGRYPRGHVRSEGREEFYRCLARGRGAVIVTAHVGCLELCQHLAERRAATRLNILVHTVHAEKFNRILRRLNPDSTARLIEVAGFGAETAVQLAERIAAGECVVIAGDRVPLRTGATTPVPFLGAPAHFPSGPYILASLLRCPVFLLFCFRENGEYVIRFELLAERVMLSRADRAAQIAVYARGYVQGLTAVLKRSPRDWFNFFDFWEQGHDREPGD
jgi:predicted LPLAT superfamily acyltransferase/glycosyltransferase involved in cell wall biosynthesis